MLHHDLTGKKFGRLHVLKRVTNSRHGKARWLCRCNCGTIKTILAANLRNGETRSCGCLRPDAARLNFTKHGLSGTPTYRTWSAMRTRCRNPRQKTYKQYGGRNITVCARWDDFANFLADMGERPPGHSIDRIDSTGNYEPSNCRWATPQEQAENSSRSRRLTFAGRTMNLSRWAEHLGIHGSTLIERLEKWPIERALSTPKLRHWSRRPQPKSA